MGIERRDSVLSAATLYLSRPGFDPQPGSQLAEVAYGFLRSRQTFAGIVS